MPVKIKAESGEVIRYQRGKNRLVFEGGIYHVTQRAPGQELLFCGNGDFQYFKHLLSRIAKNFDITLFCYSLLPNHVHLLLRIQKSNLSAAMKHLFESYAKFFNKKYKRKGHVFCGPFRAVVCDNDQYLVAASVYIHLNAFKAGLCMASTDYKWHSLRHYMPNPKVGELSQTDFVLSRIHGDRTRARQEYLRIIETAQHQPIALGRTARELRRAIKAYWLRLKELESEIEGQKICVPEDITHKKPAYLMLKHLMQLKRMHDLRREGLDRVAIQKELGLSKATYFRLKKRALSEPGIYGIDANPIHSKEVRHGVKLSGS